MTAWRVPADAWIALYLDFTPQRIRVHKGPKYTYERGRSYVDAIGRFKGVREVCDAHYCWVRYEVQSRRLEAIPVELDALRAKIDRLTERYAK